MASLVGIGVGVALLSFGWRLHWVVVAAIRFLTGQDFGPEVLPDRPDWVARSASPRRAPPPRA